jgi:hypothetical protein
MASPSTSVANPRSDLRASFMEFDMEANKRNMIGAQVLPVIEVGQVSATIGKIPIEQLLAERDTRRSPDGGYSRGKFTFTSDSYACEDNGVEEPVDDRLLKMYRNLFDAEQVAASRCMHNLLLSAEKRVAAAVFNTTTWTGSDLTTAITHEWDDATNAVPITDVLAAKKKVFAGCGMWPNALIINRSVFLNLRETDQIINRIKSSGAAGAVDPRSRKLTPAAIAEVFDLPYILVADGAKDSATEGQTSSPAHVWSDEYAMVCKIAVSNDVQEPCIGRMFHWSEDGSEIGGTMEEYRDEPKRSNIIRVRHDVDEKILYAQAGHLLSNVTT